MVAVGRSLVVAVLLLAACSGREGGIGEEQLPRTVLQPADLPEDYRRFDEGSLVRADGPRGSAGWKARYRWTGPADAAVPLVVESRVDLHEGADAAAEALADIRAELPGEQATAPDLGDEAAAATLVQPGVPDPVSLYVIAWREHNVTASLTVNGFEGKVSAEEVEALARKQAERISAAAR